MLIDVLNRQKKLGLSTRKLAKQLEVSASLLSQVITGNRQISKNMADRMARWFQAETTIQLRSTRTSWRSDLLSYLRQP
jgi:plasmid maintenance system antidote protein VapI